jgi:hypothetical protein
MSKKTKWPQKPEYVSETDMSSEEDLMSWDRSTGHSKKGYKPTRLEQTGGPQTMKEAIKPRPETALACGQNLSKKTHRAPPKGGFIRRIAILT